jgi:DsbC/DsbD-like thiol-disulfide interchange protein
MMPRLTTQRCGCLLGVAGAMGIGWLASGQPGGFTLQQRATPKLICEHQALVPGTTATLAITFEIAPNWHMYWRGQNDTGMGPTISWSLPPGYEVGETQWPVPTRKVLPGGILDHIYEDRLTILVPLRVPSEPAADSTTASPTPSIGASLRWMVCEDVCMFEDGIVALTIPVAMRPEPATNTGAQPLPLRSADARLIDDARKTLPSPWSDAKGLARTSLDVTDERVTLSIQAPGATRITFIPDEGCLPPMDLLRQGDAEGESLKIDFAAGGEDGDRISGLVRIEQGNKIGVRTFRFHEVIVRAAEDRGVR